MGFLIIGGLGCEVFPTQTKDGLPADHSDSRGYAYHKAGLTSPSWYCSECHGQNLKGGVSNGVATSSCYQCHPDVWTNNNHSHDD